MSWIGPNARQCWSALPLLLSKAVLGMNLSFTTCFMAAALQPHSPLRASLNALTWFASSLGFFGALGCVASSVLMARCGRRKAQLITTTPGLVGQLIMIFGSDIYLLTFGRILLGVSAIGATSVGTVYVAECSDPRNRAMLLNMATTVLNVGSFIVHLLGNYVSWRILAIIICIPMIANVLVAYTCPESPSWLAETRQDERSREAFYWLRGRTEDSTREIEELIRAQRHKSIDKTFTENIKGFFKKVKKKNFWKPLVLVTVNSILIEASGRHLFPSYSVQIVQEVTSDQVNPFHYNMALDVLVLAGGAVVVLASRAARVRRLLLATGGAAALLLALAALTVFLLRNHFLPPHYTWLSLLLFAMFILFTNLGCTSIPALLIGEILPLEHRGVLIVLNAFLIQFELAVGLKIMPYAILYTDIHGAFGIQAMLLAGMLLAMYFMLPETKGRTLQEIEDYFTRGRFRDGAAVPADDDVRDPC